MTSDQNKHFEIGKSFDDDRMAPEDLSTRLADWKIVADQFYRASELLFIQIEKDNSSDHATARIPPQLDQIYFFLIGMCLENLIKGILIYQNPNLGNGSELKGKIKSHDLKTLALDLKKIEILQDELELFDFLKEHIVWIGKYPIPTKATNFYEYMYYVTGKVREIFLLVYKKLSGLMESSGDLEEHLHKYEFSELK
jgi:hypothetical protein